MNKDELFKLRHSSEHILTQAMRNLGYKFLMAMGPATDEGFYFDFELLEGVIKEEDFPKIEAEMKRIIKLNLPIVKKVLEEDEARKLFDLNPYKQEWIDEIVAKGEKITIYVTGDIEDLKDGFCDICKGPHVESTGKIGAVKLLSLAGAYWRGSEKNKMLTRLYGTAFETQKEIDDYLLMLEEAKKRDHRKLGKELDLFHFDEEIGQGLPIWLPKGNIIKEQLENWAKNTETKWGYQRVTTPVITKESLFYTSGHLPLYKESMYSPIVIEEENYYIKPMNCPFHHKVFDSRSRSYRELPLRIAEYGLCHRYEDSGSLFGLMRVRGMDMNDAHIYCSQEQAIDEFVQVIKLHEYYYKILGIVDYEMELALRNPENMSKYHGSEEDWKLAEEMTIKAMEISKVPFKIVNDGAAFYGPKMDFQIKSITGRMFTASTNQLDLYMPKRFNLKYIDNEGQEKTPVVIHRAPLGTHERFIGFLIEHFGGAFPTWLSPVQVQIIPISSKVLDYAKEVTKALSDAEIRYEIDDKDETMGNKIRKAQEQKIPYMLVIGEKEKEQNKVSIRTRDNKQENMIDLSVFTAKISDKISQKSLDL